MPDLKSCPFCGSPASTIFKGDGWRVRCSECSCELFVGGADEGEAVAAWNTRIGTAVDGANETLRLAGVIRARLRAALTRALDGMPNPHAGRIGNRGFEAGRNAALEVVEEVFREARAE